ncbi:MAG: hypothetical protein L0Y72_05060 [Gemmataceae bacterium]|nr:hypothetical protein [Gemmataceae bacterium]MCI0738392.1 hypothetical protein [Gemmataceae bacterium]
MIRLLTLPLDGPLDMVRARQRARQIARLLRFDPYDQIGVAAAAFTIASQAVHNQTSAELRIDIDDAVLHLYAEPTSGSPPPKRAPAMSRKNTSQSARQAFRFERRLPDAACESPVEDLVWMIEQLDRELPLDWIDEMELQNHETLQLLHVLHTVQEQLRDYLEKKPNVA